MSESIKFGKEGPQRCQHAGCDQEATWYPLLRFFAKGFRLSPAANLLMSLPTCESCTSKMGVGDLVTDKSWDTFDKLFDAGGKALPDRDRTQLTWWKIEDVQSGRLPQ